MWTADLFTNIQHQGTFWVLTPHSTVGSYQHFKEMLVTAYKTTWCHNICFHCHKNLIPDADSSNQCSMKELLKCLPAIATIHFCGPALCRHYT